MSDQVLEQADITPRTDVEESGDVPTDEESGQNTYQSVPFVPKEAPVDTAKTKVEQNEEAKNKRISDKEWQENKEAAEKGKKLEEKVKDTLQLESPDQIELIAKQIAELKAENARKDWEIDHPIVRNDKYADEWRKVNSEPRYSSLTFDERWALINREKASSLNKELKERSQMEKSSVPVASRGTVPSKGLDPETAHIAQMGGLTEEDFRKAGML